MISELDAFTAGIVFLRDELGRLRPEGPPGADLRAAVAERRDVVLALLHRNERSGVPGACDACSGPMALVCSCVFCQKNSPAARLKKHRGSNRSGLCWLCECVVQKMIAAGEWPPRHEGQTAVRDIEAMIAALPPKPKAPWEEA